MNLCFEPELEYIDDVSSENLDPQALAQHYPIAFQVNKPSISENNLTSDIFPSSVRLIPCKTRTDGRILYHHEYLQGEPSDLSFPTQIANNLQGT